MKRITLAAIGFAFALAGEAYGAVSGYWDSSNILRSFLGRNEIADALKQQPVESIVRTDRGYQLKSRDCTVNVVVDREPSSNPGPSQFTVRVESSHCR